MREEISDVKLQFQEFLEGYEEVQIAIQDWVESLNSSLYCPCLLPVLIWFSPSFPGSLPLLHFFFFFLLLLFLFSSLSGPWRHNVLFIFASSWAWCSAWYFDPQWWWMNEWIESYKLLVSGHSARQPVGYHMSYAIYRKQPRRESRNYIIYREYKLTTKYSLDKLVDHLGSIRLIEILWRVGCKGKIMPNSPFECLSGRFHCK